MEAWRTSACCCMGMVSSQLQWLNSSLLRPVFSDPNSNATCGALLPPSAWLASTMAAWSRWAGSRRNSARIKGAASASSSSLCCRFRSPTAVVPATRVQSATASATLAQRTARASTSDASTADRAPSNGAANSLTTRSRLKPKSCIARATAPMLLGLRARTSTTHTRSRSCSVNIVPIVGNRLLSPVCNSRPQGPPTCRDSAKESARRASRIEICTPPRSYDAPDRIQASIFNPCFCTMVRSLSAMPLGFFAPVSHFSTVDSLVFR